MSLCDGDAFEFNNTVNSDGAQINQGKNVTAMQTNQIGNTVSFEQFALAIKYDIANDCDPDQAAIVREVVLEPLREISAQPEPETEQDCITLKAHITLILESLDPYAPYVRKTIAAFAEGAFRRQPAGSSQARSRSFATREIATSPARQIFILRELELAHSWCRTSLDFVDGVTGGQEWTPGRESKSQASDHNE